MRPLTSWVFEFAHQMALLPLLWLVGLHLTDRKRDVAWHWLAGAFFVSWLADTAAHWAAPWLVSAVYLVTQSAIIGAVLLDRRDAMLLTLSLTMIGVVAVLWRGVSGPDVLLHTVAWGGVAGIVLDRPALGRLRLSLLVYFGLGTLCWMGYAAWPGWTSWGLYQTSRLIGLLLFCWASLTPGPSLQVVRGVR